MRKIYQIFFMLLFVSFIGQMRAQQTVNIGETPWKFSKVIRQESNLVSGLTVLSGTDVVSGINDGKFDTGAGKPLVGKNYFVDLLEKKPIEKIKTSAVRSKKLYFYQHRKKVCNLHCRPCKKHIFSRLVKV